MQHDVQFVNDGPISVKKEDELGHAGGHAWHVIDMLLLYDCALFYSQIHLILLTFGFKKLRSQKQKLSGQGFTKPDLTN